MIIKLGTDQLHPPGTIEVLPSTVLLEIFNFYVDRPGADEDVWHTLVHVCRRWRFAVFDSPRRLNLQILYTPKRPLKILEVWPALPIVIDFLATGKRPRGMANIVAALKQHWRVRKIAIRGIPNSLMKRFAAVKKPFPELTHLELYSDDENVPILPDSFLGGSAPSLHTLDLYGIPFPAVKLLSSTRNLVTLRLWSIPQTGYISPEEMVTCLSALTALKSFDLGFRSPQSRVGGGTRRLPPLTRIVLTALTRFTFKGNSEYLEAIVSLIDTPLLDHFRITFFHQLIYDAPLLRHFIRRTEIIKAHYRAHVAFYDGRAEVGFSPQGMAVDGGFFLEISCTPSDWQLSSLAQVCSSSLLPLYTLEHFRIFSYRSHWQDDIESTQWLELLFPFTSVKNLDLSDRLVPLIAPALQQLAGESVNAVLPMLQNLLVGEHELSGPAERAIQQFIDARQRSGRPVALRGSISQRRSVTSMLSRSGSTTTPGLYRWPLRHHERSVSLLSFRCWVIRHEIYAYNMVVIESILVQSCAAQGLACVTLGYFRPTHTHAHQKTTPTLRVWVFPGWGRGFTGSNESENPGGLRRRVDERPQSRTSKKVQDGSRARWRLAIALNGQR